MSHFGRFAQFGLHGASGNWRLNPSLIRNLIRMFWFGTPRVLEEDSNPESRAGTGRQEEREARNWESGIRDQGTGKDSGYATGGQADRISDAGTAAAGSAETAVGSCQAAELAAYRRGQSGKECGRSASGWRRWWRRWPTCAAQSESLAEVAHDARNMVTALGLYCDLLEEPGVLTALPSLWQ